MEDIDDDKQTSVCVCILQPSLCIINNVTIDCFKFFMSGAINIICV